MIRYKDYFSDVKREYSLHQHIIGLLNMGYTADELSSLLKVDDDVVVKAIDDFAREQMNKIKFNDLI